MNQPLPRVEAFYRFSLGVCLFVLVLALYSGTGDPSMDIKHLLIGWGALLLAGSYVLVAAVTRTPLRRPAVFFGVILTFLGFFLVSSLFSEFRVISLHETARFFNLFALYWLATQVYATPAQVQRLFAVYCAAVALAAVYAVAQKAGIDPFPWGDRASDTYTNLPATYGNPNFAAHALILAAIMALCLFRAGVRWVVWVAPLYLFHLYSTDQRAGWIALAGAAVLVGIAWAVFRGAGRPVLRTATALALFGLSGVAAVAGAMALTHARTGHYFPVDLSLLLRYQSYVSATRMLFEAPVLGHGPAVYGLAYARYWTPFEQDWFAQEQRMNAHVHSDALEIAVDGGLAAAGLYLMMLTLGMAYGLLLACKGPEPAHRRLGYTFATLFCAFGIDGLFGFNLRVPVTAAMFFLMMGTLDGLWTRGPRPVSLSSPALGIAARVAFLAALIAAAWFETRSFAAEYHLHQGNRAHNAGNTDAAIQSFARAEALAPWNGHPARRIGLAELDRGRVAEGRAALERSLEKNPHYFINRLPLARACLMQAQRDVAPQGKGAAAAVAELDAARNHARAVLELVPDYFAALDVLARVESIAAIINRDHGTPPEPALQREHWTRARDLLRAAIDEGPERSGELYRMLHQVQLSLGDVEAAEQALIGAIQTDPEGARVWPLFLKFAREHDRFDPMRAVLFRHIDHLQGLAGRTEEQSTQLAAAYYWLGELLDSAYGDVQGAFEAYAGAVSQGPGQPELWARFAAYARAHERRKEFEETLRETCAAQREGGVTPLPQVAAVEAALADPGKQLDQATRVLLAGVRSHTPESGLPLQELYGWAIAALLEQYDALAAAGGPPCESALNLGIALAGLDDLARADALFETARGCLQGELKASAAVHHADTLLRRGEADRALALIEQSEVEFPGNLDTRWARARTLARMNRTAEARDLYNNLGQEPALTPEARAMIAREIEALPPAP